MRGWWRSPTCSQLTFLKQFLRYPCDTDLVHFITHRGITRNTFVLVKDIAHSWPEQDSEVGKPSAPHLKPPTPAECPGSAEEQPSPKEPGVVSSLRQEPTPNWARLYGAIVFLCVLELYLTAPAPAGLCCHTTPAVQVAVLDVAMVCRKSDRLKEMSLLSLSYNSACKGCDKCISCSRRAAPGLMAPLAPATKEDVLW